MGARAARDARRAVLGSSHSPELAVATAEDCDAADGFLQSGFWGAFKSGFGWKPSHFALEYVDGEGRPSRSSLLVLERRIARAFSFAYIPCGPEIDPGEGARAELLAAIAESLRARLSSRCAFIRFDAPWYEAEAESEGGADRSAAARPDRGLSPLLVKAAADVQSPDTVLLDLRPGEEEILAGMKPKWRYNIRLAARRGVHVDSGGAERVPSFYRLYESTAARDGIALHPESYYARLFACAELWRGGSGALLPDLRLWTASYRGEELAAIVTLFRGKHAVYLYGASSDSRRELMPAYALQWAAIRAAKAAGCEEYDFFGIPPRDDPSHPMAGLYRFKTGFGGRVAHRAGSWDYPLRPTLYSALRIAETARLWWFKDLQKRLASFRRRAAPR